jgi:hypothetical protein
MIMATVMASAAMARRHPPSAPRWLAANPPLRNARRMSSRNAGGIDSRAASSSRLTGTPGASASAAASAVIARTA